MHTSTNPFITDPINSTTSSQKTSPISPIKMYPANAYLNEKRSPSPTFVNITSPFDYPTPTKSHLPINHHPTTLKFAKTRDLIPKSNQSSPIPRDQTELLFPDDAYRIEFCMPSNHVICKCPPTSADILFHHQQQQQQQQQHLQNHQHHHSNTTKSRRKTKSKNEISNHQHRWRTKKCPEIPITSNCQEIINIENYCAPTSHSSQTPTAAMLHHHAATMRNHHHPPPPVYDVYSYAYLEPPPPQPPTLQQQQQFQTQKSSSPVTCLPPPIPSTSFANQPPPLYDSRGPSTSSGSTSSSTSQHGKTPSRSSIKALLAKGFRSRANGLSANALIRSRSISANGAGGSINGVGCNGNGTNPMDKYTYTTRYGTTENLYEEVNEEKIREILSADGLDIQSPAGSPGHTMITPPPQPISSKEEQRRVQNTHFRILDELNLSLEALIMPPTPPECSPTEEDPNDSGNSGGLNVSKSVENISSTLKSLDLKSNNNDVDSGYSVSSGSNITSLFYKDNFKFGKKIMASAKRSATMSAKKSSSQQSKGFNEHSSIAMTLISPSSPFKSMKKLFDTGQLQKTTIVDDDNIVGNCGNGGSSLGIGGGSMRLKNKFWTIKQW